MTQAKGSDNVLQSLGSRSCSERDNWNVRVFFPNVKKCTILKSPLVRYRSSKKKGNVLPKSESHVPKY